MSEEKIRFSCAGCNKTLSVSAHHAGKSLKCPSCSTTITIPKLEKETWAALPPLTREAPAAPPKLEPSIPTAENYWGVQGDSNQQSEQRPSLPSSSASLQAKGEGTDKVPLGRSIGGLFVASFVGLLCAIAWIVVAIAFNMELGILAWGIGGLIGFVAGSIAKNPSPIYCGLSAAVAVGSILGAKLLMTLGIMAVAMTGNFVRELADFDPNQDKWLHLQADQWLADKQLNEQETSYVKTYNAGFFGDDEFEEDADGSLTTVSEFRKRLRTTAKSLDEAQKATLLAAAKDRHPNWIENEELYTALCNVLPEEAGALPPELAEHAKAEVLSWESPDKEGYRQKIAPAEFSDRTTKLRSTIAQKIRTMDEAQIEATMKQAMALNPLFNPFPDPRIATLFKLKEERQQPPPIQEHIEATIAAEVSFESPEYFTKNSEKILEERDREVGRLVNDSLSRMSPEERTQLVAEMRAKNPSWESDDAPAVSADLEKTLDEIGDGSFWASFRQVFGLMDLLWLFLGSTTAYGTALRRATPS